MAMENKPGLTDSAKLARTEEKISKRKALEMFDTGFLDTLIPGTVNSAFRAAELEGERFQWEK